MSLPIAKRVILFMIILSLSLAILHIFFDPDIMSAVVAISSASAFYFLHRNPNLMLAKNWDEFCELYDESRDRKYIHGFPAFHVVLLLVILYIWLS